MRIAPLFYLPLFLLHFTTAIAETSDSTQWQAIASSDGSTAEARHESGAVAVNGKLYLLGGRAERSIQVFDPVPAAWINLGPMPLELHHFQPVAINDSIYLIGSFTCCYPNETLVPEIHVFNTQTLIWSIDGSMPASRTRGSAATIVRDDMIYVVGGNTLGHAGGAVAWFDSFDPATGEWSVLPDAPNARDHFAAVLTNDYLVAAAGRQTSQPNPFKNAVLATDVFDFVTGVWHTADPIPTPRAGALAGAAGDEIIVAGGEINTSTTALATVEAFNVYSGKWRELQPLTIARHSGGGVVLDGQFHVLAGSMNAGGAPETSAHEALLLDEIKSLDFDLDGLSNLDERNIHSTDPANADTDFDNLSDKDEVIEYHSDPLDSDSDGDGIADGVEVDAWNTNPIDADTDGDGLDDFEESYTYNTNPLLVDTDADELSDRLEVTAHMTDPANSDSDNDGIKDGEEVQSGLDPLNSDTDGDGVIDGQDNDPLDGTDDGVVSESQASGVSSGGNVSILLLVALIAGRLSRIRITRVKVSSNLFIS